MGVAVGDKFYFQDYMYEIYVLEDDRIRLFLDVRDLKGHVSGPVWYSDYLEVRNLYRINDEFHFSLDQHIIRRDEDGDFSYDSIPHYRYVPERVVTKLKETTAVPSAVYPNPFSNVITLKLNSATLPDNISITDLFGNSYDLSYELVNSGSLSIKFEELQLSPGVYFQNLRTEKGSENIIIIKR